MLPSYNIIGINSRNLKYLRTSKEIRQILDSKLSTKEILEKEGVQVPPTIAEISSRREALDFNWDNLPSSFVVKPNRGLGGEGMKVVYGRKKKATTPTWVKANKELVTKDELLDHILNILEGNFSLFSMPDVAFFEERVKIAKELKPYAAKGIPDIRIVVYQKVPVMAMLRLPTPESSQKANLHAGGIGVGIDMATGLTTSAISKGRLIDYYPGTRYLLRGIKIPYFKDILTLAVKSQEVVDTPFLGVDIVLDKEKGPMVLELNTRPGLAIQFANLAPLGGRLERVKGLKIGSKKKGVRIGRDLFGEREEESGEEILEKKVLGIIEKVQLIGASGEEKEVSAKIDTGAWRTTISFDLADKLGIESSKQEKVVKSGLGSEKRVITPLSFKLRRERIDTEVFVSDRSNLKYQMIVGRRDLKSFIIDPSKFTRES